MTLDGPALGGTTPRTRWSVRRSSSSSIRSVKALVRANLALHESQEVIPGFLDLTRVHNHRRGVRDDEQRGFSVQDGRCCRSWPRSRSAASPWYAATVPLGDRAGAVRHRRHAGRRGRQPDRPRGQGYVLDFVDAYWGGLALLGVQCRRRRDHGGRGLHDSRSSRKSGRAVYPVLFNARPGHDLLLRRAARRVVPARALAGHATGEAVGPGCQPGARPRHLHHHRGARRRQAAAPHRRFRHFTTAHRQTS